MDLNWLHDFECLARTLNFTRAARERNITQSAFSRRIIALENWIGSPLINRATYPIQLTDSGIQFLPVALRAISELTDIRQSIRGTSSYDTNFIRFSVLHTISVNYLANRIENLQTHIPELQTRVMSDSLSACYELLTEDAVDIMLYYDHQSASPQIDETAFARKNLLVDRLMPVATKEQALSKAWNLHQPPRVPIPYLAYERSTFLGMVVDSLINQKSLNTKTIYIDGLVETIKRRLLQGSGFAWMPETAIADELTKGSLVPIGDDTLCAHLTIVALANPTKLHPLARQLWELL